MTDTLNAACAFTDTNTDCYTASWYLIGDQVRSWLLVQIPILAVSIVYTWLEIANHPRIERLRATVFDAPITNMANYMLQIITCIYVCIAWIVRGGSLQVVFSSWSVESLFLIMTAVGYAIRWLAAKNKVLYTLKLHNLFDLLSLISHFAISFQTVADGDQYRRSWLDFGFLRSYILYVVVGHLFSVYKYKTFFAQLLLLVFKAFSLVFFAACVLFSLERLGDIPYTNSFLLHVYKCSNHDGTAYILSASSDGTTTYSECSETWSFFSSIYFIFVTVSTVGYGDFSPKTVLGQLMVCVIIVFGIYTFANESAAFMKLYGDQRGGRIAYNCSRNTLHVVVTGSPSAAQMKDFIREFFHPDHDSAFQVVSTTPVDDEEKSFSWNETMSGISDGVDQTTAGDPYLLHESALEEGRSDCSSKPKTSNAERSRGVSNQLVSKWLQRGGANRVRETHIVVLMQFDNDDDDPHLSFQQEIMQFVHENPRYTNRVFLIYGSPLVAKDLLKAKLQQAMAVFFLPNKFSNDGNKEDASTVLRVLSVRQHMEEHTQLFAMLVNSDNRKLLEATGMSSEHLVCADELRLGLMGLSCRCPGLSTLVSNLITSRSGDLPFLPEEANSAKLWISEYVSGASNEIYSCTLADHFNGLTFTEVTQRIHQQSNGLVLLIAVELEREVWFNPGRWFHITPSCKAYVIAESSDALAPFSSKLSLNSGENAVIMNVSLLRSRENLIARARQAQHNVERRVPAHVREYIVRSGSALGSFQMPSAPSRSLLAKGGHIVVCSNIAHDGGGQRSVTRLINFLRPLRAPHIERIVPVVLVDAEKLDGMAWLQLREFGEVYHVQGSPQQHHVLVAAGVYTASSIVVLAQGTEAGYDDSKAIFNAILVNSALQSSNIFTIIELRDVHNNKYLDPVTSFSSRSLNDDDYLSEPFRASEGRLQSSPRSSGYPRLSVYSQGGRSGTRRDSRYGRASSSGKKMTWWRRQKINWHNFLFYSREFFLGNLQSAAKRVNSLGPSDSSADGMMDQNVNEEDDTFFQERFMCGALFPSYVADDLLIQSFFNPSLNLFIRKILDGKSCFMLYDIPKQWRHQREFRYGELFEYMTSGISHALPIGLLRAKGGVNGAPHPYVFTCPSSETIVYPEDKVFVIINVKALHRVANMLQQRFRNRKKATKDAVTVADAVDRMMHRAEV